MFLLLLAAFAVHLEKAAQWENGGLWLDIPILSGLLLENRLWNAAGPQAQPWRLKALLLNELMLSGHALELLVNISGICCGTLRECSRLIGRRFLVMMTPDKLVRWVVNTHLGVTYLFILGRGFITSSHLFVFLLTETGPYNLLFICEHLAMLTTFRQLSELKHR